MYIFKKFPIILSLLLLLICIAIKSSDVTFIKKIQLNVFDSYQRLKPRDYQPLPVKIVDIDEQSIAKIGQWPWPRTTMAKLVDKLSQNKAANIVFDITFAEPDRTSPKQILPIWRENNLITGLDLNNIPSHDQLFVDSIKKANVVTSFALTPYATHKIPKILASFPIVGASQLYPDNFLPSFSGAVKSMDMFEEVASGNGAVNGSNDEDGIIRRMTILRQLDTASGNFFPSLAAEALRTAQGASNYMIYMAGASGQEANFGNNSGVTSVKIGDFVIPTMSDSSYWIYYTGHRPERYIPAWKILSDEVDPSLIEGTILFVGTSAVGLKDIRTTPLSQSANGVEVHAQALEQVLTGKYLTRSGYIEGFEIFFMALAALIVIFIVSKLNALWGAIATLSLLLLVIVGSWLAFSELMILTDPITPAITIILVYLTCSIAKHISEEKEKQHVRKAFSQYMSPALVEKLARNPEQLQLGGEIKELSVLFCDIRGFTTISEKFDAHELTHFINRFLTPMTNIILKNQGTIDKYMGDCIMSFWNAPLDDTQHAYHACKSALEMLEELDNLNHTLEGEASENGKTFIPINIGIGINSGDCCVGNMGSEQRFDYSIIGDNVNLASRLEGQSKSYGVNIIIGEHTHNEIPTMATIELDRVKVKGKNKAVTVYALLGDETLRNTEEFTECQNLWNRFLQHYRSQQWTESTQFLTQVSTLSGSLSFDLTLLCDLYRQRILAFKDTPPPAQWDGIYVAQSK